MNKYHTSIPECDIGTRCIRQSEEAYRGLKGKLCKSRAPQAKILDPQIIKKSRPSTILFKSVVTRLLILPRRFSALDLGVLFAVSSCLPLTLCFPTATCDAVVLTAEDWSCSAGLPSWLLSTAVLDSAIEELSEAVGVEGWGRPLLVSGISAFMRIFKACSKTSCVTMHSVRTIERVYSGRSGAGKDAMKF